MAKKIVSVYPDYCSSGLWDENGANIAESEVKMSDMTAIALKYWHWTWERWDVYFGEKPPKRIWLECTFTDWWEDGRKIAEAIQEQNPELEIQYKADTPEELIEYFYGEIK